MQLTLTLETNVVTTSAIPCPSIRPLRREDAETVGHLYFRSYPRGTVDNEAEAIADIHAALDGGYGTYLPDLNLVFEERGEVVGCFMVVDSPPWQDVSDQLFIIDLFVDPAHRGKGIARQLLSTALSSAPKDRTLGLRVDSNNVAAVSLYRSIGFKDVRTAP